MAWIKPSKRDMAVTFSYLMCWCWCFGGGGPRTRDSTLCMGLACLLELLGRMYMPGSPGAVHRYMLPIIVAAGSGWRRGEVHGVEQGGL